MTGWREVRLGDVAKFIDYRGKTPRKTESGIPLITAKIVKNGSILPPNEFIAEGDYDAWMTRGLPKIGDVVLTTEAPLGEVAQLKDAHVALAQRIIVLRAKEDVLDNTFLKYFLLSAEGQARLKSRESGTTVTGIKSSELQEVLIPIPTLSEQKRIAAILSSLDDKIEVNNQINRNLEEQAKAIFKSWFVDFEPFQNGEFIDSDLGRIPKGWKVGNLSELLEIRYGKDHKKLVDGLIPVYGSGGLMRFVDTALYSGESVLIPRKGTLNNIMLVSGDFWTVDTMFYSVPKCKGACKFSFFALKRVDLAAMNTGSAVPSMTTDILNALPVVIPPQETINTFENTIDSSWQFCLKNKKENIKLSSLRDSLLPKLIFDGIVI